MSRAQKWVAYIIIGLIAVSFVFWGLEYYVERMFTSSDTVAKVNGQSISKQSFQQAYQQIENAERARLKGAPLSSDMIKAIKRAALQQMISQIIIHQAANDAGFEISMAQVKKSIMNAPIFQENGHFSMARLQRVVYANNMTMDEFFQRARLSAIASQIASGIEQSSFVLPSEVAKAYSLIHQKRSFGYFSVPTSRYVPHIKLTDQQIKNFYQQNKLQFKTADKVRVQYLELSPKALSKGVRVSEKTVKRYYNNNKANYESPKRFQVLQLILPLKADASSSDVKKVAKQADAIAAKVNSGTSFASLLKQRKESAKPAWLTADQLPPQVLTLFNAATPGQMLKPFRAQNGFYLIQLKAIKPAKLRNFAEVKKQIYNYLQRQQVNKIFSKKSQELSNLTYTNPTTLQPAAKTLGLTVKETGWLTRASDKKNGLLANTRLLNVAFSDNVLQQGNNSNPVSLQDGTLVVLRVAKHDPAKQLSLATVRSKIVKALTQQTAQRKAGLVAYELQTALKAGQSVAALAKKYNVVWKTVSQTSAKNKTVPTQILQTAFSTLPYTKKNPVVNSTLLNNGDYVVLKVMSVQKANAKTAPAAERQKLTRGLAGIMGQVDYRLYVKGTSDAAKITYNDKSLE